MLASQILSQACAAAIKSPRLPWEFHAFNAFADLTEGLEDVVKDALWDLLLDHQHQQQQQRTSTPEG